MMTAGLRLIGIGAWLLIGSVIVREGALSGGVGSLRVL
jgi:hypothetical protein